MTARYGTFEQGDCPGDVLPIGYGVIDSETGKQYFTIGPKTSQNLADLLNEPSDCRFNCRARREADYLQGWVDRDRDCPIPEAGKRCAKRYVDKSSDQLSPEFVSGMDVLPHSQNR